MKNIYQTSKEYMDFLNEKNGVERCRHAFNLYLKCSSMNKKPERCEHEFLSVCTRRIDIPKYMKFPDNINIIK